MDKYGDLDNKMMVMGMAIRAKNVIKDCCIKEATNALKANGSVDCICPGCKNTINVGAINE